MDLATFEFWTRMKKRSQHHFPHLLPLLFLPSQVWKLGHRGVPRIYTAPGASLNFATPPYSTKKYEYMEYGYFLAAQSRKFLRKCYLKLKGERFRKTSFYFFYFTLKIRAPLICRPGHVPLPLPLLRYASALYKRTKKGQWLEALPIRPRES